MYEGVGCIHRFYTSTILQHIPYSFGFHVQLVNVNGSIYRLGGHQTHHAVWDEADSNLWVRHAEQGFGCGKLIYVNSKNIILMIEGFLYDNEE